MCRILFGKNIHQVMNYQELEHSIGWLINDNGGDGVGLAWYEEMQDKLSLNAVKTAKWDIFDSPYIAGLMLELQQETRQPVLFHTRKASIGGVTTQYTHPIILDEQVNEEREWNILPEFGDENVVYSLNVPGMLIQNGTMTKADFTALKLQYLFSHMKDIRDKDFNALDVEYMSDTQLLATVVHEFDTPYVLDTLPEHGVSIVAYGNRKEPMLYIRKGETRPLSVAVWDDDTYIIGSVLPTSVKKEAEYYVNLSTAGCELPRLLKFAKERSIEKGKR